MGPHTVPQDCELSPSGIALTVGFGAGKKGQQREKQGGAAEATADRLSPFGEGPLDRIFGDSRGGGSTSTSARARPSFERGGNTAVGIGTRTGGSNVRGGSVSTAAVSANGSGSTRLWHEPEGYTAGNRGVGAGPSIGTDLARAAALCGWDEEELAEACEDRGWGRDWGGGQSPDSPWAQAHTRVGDGKAWTAEPEEERTQGGALAGARLDGFARGGEGEGGRVGGAWQWGEGSEDLGGGEVRGGGSQDWEGFSRAPESDSDEDECWVVGVRSSQDPDLGGSQTLSASLAGGQTLSASLAGGQTLSLSLAGNDSFQPFGARSGASKSAFVRERDLPRPGGARGVSSGVEVRGNVVKGHLKGQLGASSGACDALGAGRSGLSSPLEHSGVTLGMGTRREWQIEEDMGEEEGEEGRNNEGDEEEDEDCFFVEAYSSQVSTGGSAGELQEAQKRRGAAGCMARHLQKNAYSPEGAQEWGEHDSISTHEARGGREGRPTAKPSPERALSRPAFALSQQVVDLSSPCLPSARPQSGGPVQARTGKVQIAQSSVIDLSSP